MSKHFLQRFLRHRRGNVLMLTGLSILVLFALGGAGFDFGRQQLVRMKLQTASDAAALAAATLPESASESERRAIALRYFNLNFPDPYLGIARPSPNINTGGQITVDASSQIESNFISNVGVNTLGAEGRSVVNRATSQSSIYDVLLVMDNSNSMAYLAPASRYAFSPVTDRTTAYNLMRTSCVADMAAYAPSACVGNLRPFMANGLQRETPYGSSEICRSSYANEYCNGVVYGSNPLNVLNDPTDDGYGYGLEDNTRLNALRAVVLDFLDSMITSGPQGNRIGLISWATTVRWAEPLTNDISRLRNRVNMMGAWASTNPHAALQETLSQAGSFDPAHVKAVVFLSDGKPTRYNGGGCDGGSFCQPAVNASLPICTQLKNNGVQVYTIGFGLDDAPDITSATDVNRAKDFLRNCASLDANGNPRFYDAATGADLEAAFNQITTALSKIRISE